MSKLENLTIKSSQDHTFTKGQNFKVGICSQKMKQKKLNDKDAIIKKKSKHIRKTFDSEFQSYTYIKNELKRVGWNVNNPNRDTHGQVYTQQECLKSPEIASKWGQVHPEYVIKLNEENYWIIEAKPKLEDKDTAIDEAEYYGKLLNEHKFVRAIIVTGVAGNDIDKYYIKNELWIENKKSFKPITYDGKEVTSILDPDIVQELLHEKNPNLEHFQIPNDELIKTAENINEIFHSASIQKDIRAPVIATILLSLSGETEPNVNAKPDVFVNDINSRAKNTLKEKGKEDFFKYIEIDLPEKVDAKDKYKEALVKAFFALRKINIKSAMRTGSDVLGRFYEVFLSYGNGAKDLGIVLTPTHITEFAADVLNINNNDIVYDPTCGTGGFLVSALYKIKRNYNQTQFDSFRINRIFGIEYGSIISTLAITNMIFRGDGRNNIINDNCLPRRLIAHTINGEPTAKFVSQNHKDIHNPVTKVLMNPPFALREKDEKEYKFINHALAQLEDNGLLFAILPCAAMVKGSGYQNWREDLLKKNTLLSVITFPDDLFYPQSNSSSLAIIVKKGIPHQEQQKVLWVKTWHDGFRKIKSKRIRDKKIDNDLEKIKPLVQSFIMNQNIKIENIPKFQKATTIDYMDTNFELIPEAYLDETEPTISEIQEGVEDTIRDTVAFLIKSGKEQTITNETI